MPDAAPKLAPLDIAPTDATDAAALKELNLDELRELARDRGYDLGKAKKEDDVIAAIVAAAVADLTRRNATAPAGPREPKKGDEVVFVAFGGGRTSAVISESPAWPTHATLRTVYGGKEIVVSSSPHDPYGVASDSWHFADEPGSLGTHPVAPVA